MTTPIVVTVTMAVSDGTTLADPTLSSVLLKHFLANFSFVAGSYVV